MGGETPRGGTGRQDKPNPEREKFSVPHAARDPEILKDRKMEKEDIFDIIRNPPDVGAIRILKSPNFGIRQQAS